MHGIWMMFDPRRALTALAVMITVSAITLHFLVLSTTHHSWLGTASVTEGCTHQLLAGVPVLPGPLEDGRLVRQPGVN